MPDLSHPHPDCGECNAYLAHRGDVLSGAVVEYARRRSMDPKALLVEFVKGVHRRHLAGLSLAAR
jgi:hypothetical protein